MIAKLTPAEGAGLAAGQPVRLHTAPDHLLVFGEDGRRLRAMPLLSHAAREAAHG